jgi:ankyrin repeat protein
MPEREPPDLVDAILAGDAGAVKRIAKSLRSVANVKHRRGPPLNVAAKLGEAAMVRVLLAHRASPDSLDADAYTPLHHAAEHGDIATARALVDAGAKLDKWNASEGQVEVGTPLHFAAARGDVAMTKLLLKAGASPRGGRYSKALGAPIHRAMRAGEKYVATARALLAAGAEPETTDPSGGTALGLACRADAAELVALLLEPRGTRKLRQVSADDVVSVRVLEVLKQVGAAPALSLEQAARIGATDLVEAGVVNAGTADRLAALRAAACGGHAEAAKVLYASLSRAEVDAGVPSVLWCAAIGGLAWLVREELGRGFDVGPLLVDPPRPSGESPAAWLTASSARPLLPVVAERGHQAVLVLLLGAGADLHAREARGTNALDAAAATGQVAVLRFLLQQGARICEPTSARDALHWRPKVAPSGPSKCCSRLERTPPRATAPARLRFTSRQRSDASPPRPP